MEEIDRSQLYHQVNGSRRLKDQGAENVAQVLSDPKTAPDVTSICDVTAEDIAGLYRDAVFKRRVAYLTRKKNKPKVVAPRTPEEYIKAGMKRLHLLSRKAKDAKDQVAASRAMISSAIELSKGGNAMPSPSGPDIDALKNAFNTTKTGDDK